ncbi:MAG: AmmeMemoRadiSam system radical SAM enzyme [Candidatus Omnitrophica bacterium]|nr:AmmeMemoRadiSam system radical SAM enzyme [Candidatus Omnitrophota bacterium]
MKSAVLWRKINGKSAECYLCAHNCVITPGTAGLCSMRENRLGELYSLNYGKIIARHVDPIEKKPLYHFLPGSYSYSIAAPGCNFRCGFCQNWTISQLKASQIAGLSGDIAPERIAKEAMTSGCKSVSYTYTEPTVYFEYAFDASLVAKKAGLYNIFVTNGFMGPESIDEIRPLLDASNIDLKFFRDSSYREHCSGRLDPVLRSIIKMKKAGIWVEITTLLIPGLNDSAGELSDIAGFIAGVDSGIPWHISRFHPDHKYTGIVPTPPESLEKAKEIGMTKGLKYVYMGNVAKGGDTECPKCGKIIIERDGFSSLKKARLFSSGKCLSCGEKIEGVWE